MGREEWKTNSFPDIPAAYTKTREDDDMSFPSIFSSKTYPEVTVLIHNYLTWNTGWSNTDFIENWHCQRIDNLLHTMPQRLLTHNRALQRCWKKKFTCLGKKSYKNKSNLECFHSSLNNRSQNCFCFSCFSKHCRNLLQKAEIKLI